MLAHIFVYGTLKSGFSNETAKVFHAGSHYISAAKTKGELFLVDSYPGFIKSKRTSNVVYGEVFLMKNPSRLLPVLDQYEGEDYSREIIEVELEKGDKMDVWIYVYRQELDRKKLK